MDNSIQAHQKELCNKLWAMANALRGNMEAYEFKNYILGMIFYYYLSDKTEKYMVNLLKDDNISYEDAWNDDEYKAAIVEEALRDLGYIIEPEYLFRKMVKMVENRSFDIEFLQKAINALMESTIGNDSQEDFDGLFSDMRSILRSWGIPLKTEVLSWRKSLLRWTRSISAWMTRRLMCWAMPTST